MKKWTILSCIILLLLAAGGCDPNLDNSAYHYSQNDHHNNQNNRMSTKDLGNNTTHENLGNRTADRKHYVEDDITNQNPNFLDLNRTGSGSESGAGNMGQDTDKAKQVIRDTHEFTPDSVWINGDRMTVTVRKNGRLTSRQKRDAEARLHTKLIQALPRYNIQVRVNEDRR